MDRLPYQACLPYYDALGLEFKNNNPAQYEVLIGDDRFPCIIGGERGGKALDINTIIPTTNGMKFMKDIIAGDYVFGDDGLPAMVVATSGIQDNRPCSKIIFDDGSEIIADDEHEWATQTSNERKNSRRIKINKKEQRIVQSPLVSDRKFGIRTTSEISNSLIITGQNRSDYANHTIVNSMPVQYAKQKLEIEPYTLGIWLGDGHSGGAYFTTNDIEVVENISKIYPVKKVKSIYTWKFGEKGEIIKLLRSLNIFKNKHIPTKYLESSIEDRISLLHGLMDSDGYIDSRGQCYFDNTNKNIIDGIRKLLSSLGIKSYVTESIAKLYGKNCGKTWTVFFVTDFHVSRIKRKYERQKLSVGKNAKQRSIISIEKVKSVPVKCIEVDNKSHLYLAGETYIPTHNSFVAAAILLPHLLLLPLIRKDRFFNENGKPKFNYLDKTVRPLQPDFVIFGPNYREPRIEFEMVETWLRELGMIARLSKPTEGAWRLVTKDGVVLQTWSTDDPMGIRGLDLEGAIAAECGNMEYESILRIQGRISSKRGFLIYEGTMENSKRWFVKFSIEGRRQNKYRIKTYSIPTWCNLHEFPGGENDPEILRLKQLYPEDTWAMRIAAEPIPPRERVINEIHETHIRKVKFPRDDNGKISCNIELWIDPGYNPSAYAVLWVAWWNTDKGKIFYVFDEFYEQKMQTEDVIQRCIRHKFYKFIKQDGIVIDVSAKRHADGNEPAVEIYRKRMHKEPYTKYWHENALIERIRSSARSNQIFIHPNCSGLIAELGLGEEVFDNMHPWRFPIGRDGIIVSDKPEDKWNHSCKALGYGLLKHLGLVERLGERPPIRNRLKKVHNIFDKRHR
jgi:hypothetical protein